MHVLGMFSTQGKLAACMYVLDGDESGGKHTMGSAFICKSILQVLVRP